MSDEREPLTSGEDIRAGYLRLARAILLDVAEQDEVILPDAAIEELAQRMVDSLRPQ